MGGGVSLLFTQREGRPGEAQRFQGNLKPRNALLCCRHVATCGIYRAVQRQRRPSRRLTGLHTTASAVRASLLKEYHLVRGSFIENYAILNTLSRVYSSGVSRIMFE